MESSDARQKWTTLVTKGTSLAKEGIGFVNKQISDSIGVATGVKKLVSSSSNVQKEEKFVGTHEFLDAERPCVFYTFQPRACVVCLAGEGYDDSSSNASASRRDRNEDAPQPQSATSVEDCADSRPQNMFCLPVDVPTNRVTFALVKHFLPAEVQYVAGGGTLWCRFKTTFDSAPFDHVWMDMEHDDDYVPLYSGEIHMKIVCFPITPPPPPHSEHAGHAGLAWTSSHSLHHHGDDPFKQPHSASRHRNFRHRPDNVPSRSSRRASESNHPNLHHDNDNTATSDRSFFERTSFPPETQHSVKNGKSSRRGTSSPQPMTDARGDERNHHQSETYSRLVDAQGVKLGVYSNVPTPASATSFTTSRRRSSGPSFSGDLLSGHRDTDSSPDVVQRRKPKKPGGIAHAVSDTTLTRQEFALRREAENNRRLQQTVLEHQDRREREAENLRAKLAASEKLKESLDKWALNIDGSFKDVRALLSTLQEVLWKNHDWTPSPSSVLMVNPGEVKKAYRQALLICHPDKHQKAAPDQQYRADRIFQALNESFKVAG